MSRICASENWVGCRYVQVSVCAGVGMCRCRYVQVSVCAGVGMCRCHSRFPISFGTFVPS